MSAISAIALSGMRASQTSLQASAHNIANLGTEDFRRQDVIQSELTGGGVAARVVQVEVPGHALEDDLIGQLQARHAFLANLSIFRTREQMLGTLLDTTA